MSTKVLGSDPFQDIGLEAPAKPVKKSESKKKKAASTSKAKAEPAKKSAKRTTKKATITKKKPAASKSVKPKTAKKKPAKAINKTKKATAAKSASSKINKTASKEQKQVKIAAIEKAPSPAATKTKPKPAPKRETEFKRPEVKPSPLSIPQYPETYKQLRPEKSGIGEEFGFDPKYQRFLEPFIQFFYRFFWRVEIDGIENIPNDERAVLVANHAGIFPYDSLMVRAALQREHPQKRNIWPLVEDFIYYAPFLGTIASRLGMVRACQENAQRLLAEDELVLVFPEGIKGIEKPYSKRYDLQRFGRGGFIKLCLLADSPVIPVSIIGSEETHPILANLRSVAKLFKLPYFPITPTFPAAGPLGLFPLPSKWKISFGKPIYVNQFGPEAADDRVAVSRLTHEVKSTIQRMINEKRGRKKKRRK